MSKVKSITSIIRKADRKRRSDLSRVELIVEHYTAGRHLSDSDERYRQQLEHANQLALEGFTRKHVADALMEHFGIMQNAAYRTIRESEEVFGSVNKANKEGLRYLLTEQLKDVAKTLRDKGEHELWFQVMERIAKINRLDVDDRPAPKVLMPKTIIFTSDPLALDLQHQEEAAEEIDYEQLP